MCGRSEVFIVKPYHWEKNHKVNGSLLPFNIIHMVADYYGITTSQMKARTRQRSIALPRQMAMALLMHFTELILADIAHILGRIHHTTVLHAHRTIQDLCETNEKIYLDRKILINKIKSHVNQCE